MQDETTKEQIAAFQITYLLQAPSCGAYRRAHSEHRGRLSHRLCRHLLKGAHRLHRIGFPSGIGLGRDGRCHRYERHPPPRADAHGHVLRLRALLLSSGVSHGGHQSERRAPSQNRYLRQARQASHALFRRPRSGRYALPRHQRRRYRRPVHGKLAEHVAHGGGAARRRHRHDVPHRPVDDAHRLCDRSLLSPCHRLHRAPFAEVLPRPAAAARSAQRLCGGVLLLARTHPRLRRRGARPAKLRTGQRTPPRLHVPRQCHLGDRPSADDLHLQARLCRHLRGRGHPDGARRGNARRSCRLSSLHQPLPVSLVAARAGGELVPVRLCRRRPRL